MNSENREIDGFLREEIERLKTSTRRGYTIGVTIMLVIAGYLGIIFWNVNRILVPEDLGMILVTEVQIAAEEMIEDYGADMEARAVPMVEDLSKQILEEYIPSMGSAARAQITLVHQEKLPYLSNEFSKSIEAYIESHSAELRLIEQGANNEADAKAFVDGMIDELIAAIDQSMREEHPGVGSLAYLGENVDFALLAIDETVSSLVETDIELLSRSDRLKRRALAHLVRMALDEQSAPVAAASF